MRIRTIIFFLPLSILLISCGYHFRGTGSSLPPHIKKIYIPIFKNLTTRFELDIKLTQKVREEVVARGKVELVGDEASADAAMIGEITSFTATPIAFSDQSAADRYNITIITNIVLRDLVNRKVIFSNPHFIYQKEYEVQEGTDFETVQTEAIEEVAGRFARSLVITIVEGF
jgi:outer membrane lipopolysaccharide assembly protein LptE/RlpB